MDLPTREPFQPRAARLLEEYREAMAAVSARIDGQPGAGDHGRAHRAVGGDNSARSESRRGLEGLPPQSLSHALAADSQSDSQGIGTVHNPSDERGRRITFGGDG